jgi:hypothetical protein
MQTIQNYMTTTKQRITLEWALIEMENDTPETAHQLGKLIRKWLRRDMVHVNVIPLNPTGGYGGGPSGRNRVNEFINILEDQYGVACTPRVRRGIDINAGCGQLKAEVEKRQREQQPPKEEVEKEEPSTTTTQLEFILDESKKEEKEEPTTTQLEFVLDEEDPTSTTQLEFSLDEASVTMSDEEDWEDYEYQSSEEKDEVNRFVSLVKDSVITADNGVVGSPSK